VAVFLVDRSVDGSRLRVVGADGSAIPGFAEGCGLRAGDSLAREGSGKGDWVDAWTVCARGRVEVAFSIMPTSASMDYARYSIEASSWLDPALLPTHDLLLILRQVLVHDMFSKFNPLHDELSVILGFWQILSHIVYGFE
jgi:hypothetical protein